MNRRNKSPLPGFPWKGQFKTKDEIDQYFSDPDGIQCLLCGHVFGTLSGHLNIVHECSHEEYRGRYGLPWRKGLVSRNVSKGFSTRLKKRIKNGSFIPKADIKTAVDKIRAGGRRKDQPFHTAFKAKRAIELNRQKIRYGRKDFEKVLSIMLKNKVTLQQASLGKNLPARSRVINYAESNPEFRKKLMDTYYALPYSVQAKARTFSPQFYEDLKRLKAKGLPNKEIGRQLGISHKTVGIRLERLRKNYGTET
jgi:hypothetical protein